MSDVTLNPLECALDEAQALRGQVDALLAENAKLRELVADAWRLFTEHGAVHPSNLPDVDAVRDRMRELGIEV